MKDLTYTKQRAIEGRIEALLAEIGVKCRGRLEVDDGDKVTVIEFVGDEKGKWKRTSWHGLGGDEAFSMFEAFRHDVPTLRRMKAALAAADKEKP